MTGYHLPPRPHSVFSDSASPDRPHRLRHRATRACAACGCRLASDNHGKVCTPCARREAYDPRLDGDFPRKLADYLGRHYGRHCDPCAAFAVLPEARYYVLRRIRDLNAKGWQIVGCAPPLGGYRVATMPGRSGGNVEA